MENIPSQQIDQNSAHMERQTPAKQPEKSARSVLSLGFISLLSLSQGALHQPELNHKEPQTNLQNQENPHKKVEFLTQNPFNAFEALRNSKLAPIDMMRLMYDSKHGLTHEEHGGEMFETLKNFRHLNQEYPEDPNFPKNPNLCGPTSLAMITAWQESKAGKTFTTEELKNMIYQDSEAVDIPENKKTHVDPTITGGIASQVMDNKSDSYGPLMREYLTDRGLDSEFGGEYSVDAVRQEIHEGNPVLLYINRIGNAEHKGFRHIVVVSGIDKNTGNLLVQDPRNNLAGEDWFQFNAEGGKDVIYPANGIKGELEYTGFTRVSIANKTISQSKGL